MKENNKSLIKYNLIKLAIYIVFMVLIFIFRHYLVGIIKYYIGTVMLIYGFEELVYSLIFHGKHFFHEEKMYLGTVEIVLGFVMIFVPMEYASACVIWATWSIIRESYELREMVLEIKHIIPKIITGVESVTAIVFSIMMIITPSEHHALIHTYLLVVELFLAPLVPLLDEVLTNSKEEEKEPE